MTGNQWWFHSIAAQGIESRSGTFDVRRHRCDRCIPRDTALRVCPRSCPQRHSSLFPTTTSDVGIRSPPPLRPSTSPALATQGLKPQRLELCETTPVDPRHLGLFGNSSSTLSAQASIRLSKPHVSAGGSWRPWPSHAAFVLAEVR